MFKIQIDTSKPAFADDADREIARILRTLADRVENVGTAETDFALYDLNGARVGLASTEE